MVDFGIEIIRRALRRVSCDVTVIVENPENSRLWLLPELRALLLLGLLLALHAAAQLGIMNVCIYHHVHHVHHASWCAF